MADSTFQIVLFIANLLVAGVVGFVGASFKIGEYRNKVDSLESTVGRDEHGGLRKTLGEVRDKVIACETNLTLRGPLTQKKSPISLTERGDKFLKDSGGEKFVDEHFTELLEKVESLSPQTSYDIQESSKQAIEGLKEDERINPIKEFLYKDGSTLEDLFTVMGVYLRDKILKHKNIDASDVDKYDPRKNGK